MKMPWKTSLITGGKVLSPARPPTVAIWGAAPRTPQMRRRREASRAWVSPKVCPQTWPSLCRGASQGAWGRKSRLGLWGAPAARTANSVLGSVCACMITVHKCKSSNIIKQVRLLILLSDRPWKPNHLFRVYLVCGCQIRMLPTHSNINRSPCDLVSLISSQCE